nr:MULTISPECIES: cell division protein ZapA [unclassified Ruminococcus]
MIFVIEKTRVKLRIVGSEFVVSADEDKDYIVKISNKVDSQIKEILRESDSMTVAMAAILAALNYCDELEKEKIITEELLKRTETSESLAYRTTGELEYLRIENKQLREEKLGLHKIIEELQSGTGDVEQQPQQPEESPQQLRIPLPGPDDEQPNAKDEQVVPQLEAEQPKPAEPEITQEKSEEAEPKQQSKYEEPKTEKVQEQPDKTQQPAIQQEQKPMLTARQMLEEKRKALLAQKNALPNAGAKSQNRPKPFRPVPSAKSGGGAFAGNRKIDPKINYRDNDKISDSFRRNDFAEIPSEEEMLSFFDRR